MLPALNRQLDHWEGVKTMKEIRLYFYKSMRKNSKYAIKSYNIYCTGRHCKNKYSLNMDFYDAMERLSTSEYKFVSIAATNYSGGSFFNVNDLSNSNLLDITESRRYNTDNKHDLVELVKLVYHYMILFGSDFDYNYNPFKDCNVIFHLGNLAK